MLPRRRGPGEAELAAVAAPDETAVFFCRTDGGADGWLGDFVELEPEHGDADLQSIDHVVLSQPFDYFDEAALFYRSILGLQPHDSQDLAGPDGLLRSRSVSDPTGRLRLALTVPRLGGGEHGPLAELQHVAFASHDAIAAARRMREQGVPLLAIPDNYYDDLAARTELDDDTVETLRELGVLYEARPVRRVPALLHRDGRRPPVLRGGRTARRLRRVRRAQLTGPAVGAAVPGGRGPPGLSSRERGER